MSTNAIGNTDILSAVTSMAVTRNGDTLTCLHVEMIIHEARYPPNITVDEGVWRATQLARWLSRSDLMRLKCSGLEESLQMCGINTPFGLLAIGQGSTYNIVGNKRDTHSITLIGVCNDSNELWRLVQ